MVESSDKRTITIDIKEVMDYSWCPMYHRLKSNYPNVQIISNAYDEALHKCFYSYLTKMQNDNFVDLGYLKQSWGKIWIKEKRNSEIIIKPTPSERNTHNKKRKEGIDSIISFHNLMSEVNQYPIIINKQFSIRITKNIILTGVWEYIREIFIDNKKVFQVLKFNTANDKFQTIMQMAHDIELTAASYAFNKMFNTDPELVYVNIYKERIVPSYREEEDYELLKQSVISAVKGIKQNIACISPDKRCFHCEYRKECGNKIDNLGG